MMDFARENERSELTGELIGDTLDDALADDGDAEAEDKIVSQVSRVRRVGLDLSAVRTALASSLGTWRYNVMVPPWLARTPTGYSYTELFYFNAFGRTGIRLAVVRYIRWAAHHTFVLQAFRTVYLTPVSIFPAVPSCICRSWMRSACPSAMGYQRPPRPGWHKVALQTRKQLDNPSRQLKEVVEMAGDQTRQQEVRGVTLT